MMPEDQELDKVWGQGVEMDAGEAGTVLQQRAFGPGSGCRSRAVGARGSSPSAYCSRSGPPGGGGRGGVVAGP